MRKHYSSAQKELRKGKTTRAKKYIKESGGKIKAKRRLRKLKKTMVGLTKYGSKQSRY